MFSSDSFKQAFSES